MANSPPVPQSISDHAKNGNAADRTHSNSRYTREHPPQTQMASPPPVSPHPLPHKTEARIALSLDYRKRPARPPPPPDTPSAAPTLESDPPSEFSGTSRPARIPIHATDTEYFLPPPHPPPGSTPHDNISPPPQPVHRCRCDKRPLNPNPPTQLPLALAPTPRSRRHETTIPGTPGNRTPQIGRA